MPLPATAPDRCPLCGGPNGCALETERATGVKQGPCWCTRARFDAALLARVPAAARHLACICARCAGADLRDGLSPAAPPPAGP